jgi:diguanylate cyclase (GGDEF)-like protein
LEASPVAEVPDLSPAEQLLRRALAEHGAHVQRRLTEEKERAVQLAAFSREDPATELLRYGYFRERLRFECACARAAAELAPLALMVIDIDRFGALQRQHGYALGEELIARLAKSLRAPWIERPARRPPVFAREGGDSFAIILAEAAREEAAERGERVREIIERQAHAGVRVTASLGVAVAAACDGDDERLLAAAHRALGAARAEGGNRVVMEACS